MGLTVLDAGVIIGVLDARDSYHTSALRAVAEAVERGDDLVVPASAYAESLVSPFRRGEKEVATVDALVDELPARIQPITREAARAAARIRARHGASVRLPDALVLATAVVLRADRVVTSDAGWPDVGVRVELLARGQS